MADVTTFRALVVREHTHKTFHRAVEPRSIDDLPPGDLLVRVHYSSLNYKDALSATGNRGVTRHFPHTPGIDAAGVIEASSNPDWKAGDTVLAIGYDLGMNTPGGFGEYIRIPAAWAIPCPDGLSLRESMIYGTAGFTAALSLYRLMDYGVVPEQGEVLVTGATGGVGSMAVALLAHAGYKVVAATGKADQAPFLHELGAQTVISRQDAMDSSGRPMLRGRWAGVIDTVGGEMLATALKSTQYGAGVTSCGLVASPDLFTTVYPFILRAVTLMGIDTAECPLSTRAMIWDRLATVWKLANLDQMVHEIVLEELENEIARILRGEQVGRVVVNLQPG